MKQVFEKINENKKGIGITVIVFVLLLIITIGIVIWINYENKMYKVEEVGGYNYYTINQDGKIGIIDLKGDKIIESKYDSIKIPNPQKPVFICQSQDKITILNEKKEQLFVGYEEVREIPIKGIVSNMPYEKSVLRYKKDGKYGLINFAGKVITKPIYEEIEGLTNKESEMLVKKDGKYGVINSRGATIINPQYESIVGDGFYTAKEKYQLSGYIVSEKKQNGYRYGYINNKLKKVLNPEYNEIYRIIETEETKDVYLIAYKNGQAGVIKNDKIMINYGYQDIEYDEYNKLFKLQRNSKYGVADITGKQIVAVEYDEIDFNAMFISVMKEEKEILFDTQGNEIKDVIYTSLLKTENNAFYISVNKEGFYGVLSKEKDILIENKYYYIEYLFNDYFIAATAEGDLGIIDSKDYIIIDFKYDVLQKIQNSNMIEAKTLKDNNTQLYSKTLQQMASMSNATVYRYENYIEIYTKDEVKYFDLEGKEISNTEIFKDNILFTKKQNGKWGFIDKSGKTIIDYMYDKVTEFNEYGFAGIQQNGKWGVVDKTGNRILEPTYLLPEGSINPEFIGKYYKVYYGYGESYYTDLINENS